MYLQHRSGKAERLSQYNSFDESIKRGMAEKGVLKVSEIILKATRTYTHIPRKEMDERIRLLADENGWRLFGGNLEAIDKESKFENREVKLE